VKRRLGCLNSSSLARSAPFRKDYPLIVDSSTEKARFFECLGSRGSGRHLPRFRKGVDRSRVQAVAVDHQIGCDGHDMNAIAPGAVKCADIEAGWSPRATRDRCVLASHFGQCGCRPATSGARDEEQGSAISRPCGRPTNPCSEGVYEATRRSVEAGSASDPLEGIWQDAERRAVFRQGSRACNADRTLASGWQRETNLHFRL
jgi:hypothetical protein